MEAERLRKLALILWISIGVVLLGAVSIYAAVRIRFIWLPIALAVGVAIILAPLVRWLTNRGWPRVVATFFAFLISGVVLVGIGALVLPTVGEQAAEFSSDLPELFASVLTGIEATTDSLWFDIDQIWNEDAIADWLADPDNQQTVQGLLATLGAGAGRLIFGVTGFALALLLAPVLGFYMLVDLPRYRATALELTPPDHRAEVAFVGSEVGTAMGAFVRGQLVIAFLVAVMSSIGMWAIDLPFWLIVGIVAGVTNLVPFVGPIVGSALGVLVALLNGSLTQALLALAIFVVVQQIESQILTPVVQRTMVKMAPVVVLIAIIVGGVLAGLLGVLIAIPFSVAVRIVVGHLWTTRVLGQSWQEASASTIEMTDAPAIRLAGRADASERSDTDDLAEADETERA